MVVWSANQAVEACGNAIRWGLRELLLQKGELIYLAAKMWVYAFTRKH